MVKEPFEFMTQVEEKNHQVRNNLQLVLILYFAEVEEILDEDHMRNAWHAAEHLLRQSTQDLKEIQSAMYGHGEVQPK